jgi:hypothetical protein
MNDPRFDMWLAALERRHLADLQFGEVTRALRALSSNYVERRERLASRSALDTAGKRAAYALYYGPLHALTVNAIVEWLQADRQSFPVLLDLGCGSGAAGVAWAVRLPTPPAIVGVDSLPWSLQEAEFTYRTWGVDGGTRRLDAARAILPRSGDAVLAAWFLNELSDEAREIVRNRLLRGVSLGTAVLIVEPIATRVSPWWDDWTRAFEKVGGRADEWRFDVELPDLVKRLGAAAGLRNDQLKARSIYVGRSR